MAPVAAEEGGVIYMSDKAPSRADDIRWAVTTGCEDPELLIQMIDYLYSDEGALLCNYGIEGETFEYDENGTPHFSDLINNNPDYDYRTAIFLYVMDSGPTVVDPMRGTASYTQEQLDSWSEWTDANLDYSHVIPNKAILKAEDSEYSSIMSDIETFMDEMTVKYITGEYSFDTYDTDFVEALEGMNIERCIELYQDAYDEYYGA
jgi:putative aldouronate transport system substrate-binding protein